MGFLDGENGENEILSNNLEEARHPIPRRILAFLRQTGAEMEMQLAPEATVMLWLRFFSVPKQ
jgi:hypothetical protein